MGWKKVGQLSTISEGHYLFDARQSARDTDPADLANFVLSDPQDPLQVEVTVRAHQPAPMSAYSIDWEFMEAVSGSLADKVVQAETSGGQPFTSTCEQGERVTVPYTAQYCGCTSWLQYDSGRRLTRAHVALFSLFFQGRSFGA